jgi:hypothetical protein
MNLIEEFIYVTEVNRIIQGLSKKSGKPEEHINTIWKDTEKEVVSKHQYGVTDKYKAIGKIVRSKLGVKADEDDK